ncbi:MAG: hypothetical protein ACI8RZ_005628 [Myxococcota bacterium]|jgi:hypothetical protein
MMSIILTLLLGCETTPQTSYCEALCDWASECAAGERDVEDGLVDDCLTATEAAEADCATASTDGVAAGGGLLTTCTDAVDAEAAAGECGGFTGTIDELKVATTPTECVSQGADAQATFEVARDAVAETNDQLCSRFTTTYCEAMDACLISELGDIPDSVWENLGGSAVELCQDSPGIATFTTSCTDEQLYLPEASLEDVNTARQGARECMRGFDAVTCNELLSGDIPKTCAAAFTSTDQAVGFAGGLLDISDQIREAVEASQ